MPDTATLTMRDLLTAALATGTAQVTDPKTGRTCQFQASAILSLAGHLARTPSHREGVADATMTVKTVDPEGAVFRVGPFTRYELAVDSTVIDRCAEAGCYNPLAAPHDWLWCTEHIDSDNFPASLASIARRLGEQRAAIDQMENWTRAVADERRAHA